MIKKTIRPVLACLLFSGFAYAQKNLKEGIIALNNHDTLKGFIDYREWYRTPVSILFTPAKESTPKKYSKNEISYFEITGIEAYERYMVTISMDEQILGNIAEKDTSGITDTVFLKIHQQGNGKNVVLMSYTDGLKQRFYILQKDEMKPVELQNSIYYLNGQIKEERQYRSLLLNIAAKYLPGDFESQALIKSADYTNKTLEDICFRLNGLKRAKKISNVEKRMSGFRFFAGVGLSRAEYKFSGSNHFAGSNMSPSYFPFVSAGVDIFVNPYVGKMFLRNQFSFTNHKTDAYTFADYFSGKENYYFKFKQVNVLLNEQLNYNLYNEQAFKWFIGAGVGFNFSSYPVNQQTFVKEGLSDTTISVINDYIIFTRKFWLNGSARSGVVIKNLEFSLSYFLKSDVSDIHGYDLGISSFQFQLNYLFNK